MAQATSPASSDMASLSGGDEPPPLSSLSSESSSFVLGAEASAGLEDLDPVRYLDLVPEFGLSEHDLSGAILGQSDQHRSLMRNGSAASRLEELEVDFRVGKVMDSSLMAHPSVGSASLPHTLLSGLNLDFPKSVTSGTQTQEQPSMDPAGSSSGPQKPPGDFLEPCTHFFSNSEPCHLFHCLMDAVVLLGFDFEPNKQQYLLDCVAYRRGSRLSFHIHIFQSPRRSDPGKYAIEFQRRCGDIVHFAEVYRTVYLTVKSRGCVAAEVAPLVVDDVCQCLVETRIAAAKPLRFTSPPPPPPMSEAADSEDHLALSKSTVDCLVSMARSPAVDMKAQALQALCELCNSGDGEIQNVVIEGEGLTVLINALDCPDQDVHRPAITALADLLLNNPASSLDETLLQRAVASTLLKLGLSNVKQIIRECARALAALASRVQSRLVSADKPRFAVDVHNFLRHASRDARAETHASEFASAIGYGHLLQGR